MKPKIVILAAGAGRRYGGLKQLAPIGPSGETLLEYSAFDALRAGFGEVVLVVRSATEPVFRHRLDAGMARRVAVRYVHQRRLELPPKCDPPRARSKPWGTAHAVLAAEPAIDGPFAVVNADDLYGAESYVELARCLSRGGEDNALAAVGFRVGETLTDAGPVSRALLEVSRDGRLERIVEVPEVWRRKGQIVYRREGLRESRLRGDELVSMNMWGFTPGLFPELRRRFIEFVESSGGSPDAEFLLPDVVQALVAAGTFRVDVLRGGGEWCGLTFHQDLERVRSLIAARIGRGVYPGDLWR